MRRVEKHLGLNKRRHRIFIGKKIKLLFKELHNSETTEKNSKQTILKKVREKSAAAENIKLVIYDRLSRSLLSCIISEKEGNVYLDP